MVEKCLKTISLQDCPVKSGRGKKKEIATLTVLRLYWEKVKGTHSEGTTQYWCGPRHPDRTLPSCHWRFWLLVLENCRQIIIYPMKKTTDLFHEARETASPLLYVFVAHNPFQLVLVLNEVWVPRKSTNAMTPPFETASQATWRRNRFLRTLQEMQEGCISHVKQWSK